MAVTDYLRGAGTQADPYVIHNSVALSEFLTNGYKSSLYFEVVANINLASTFSFKSAPNFTLNLNGYSVSGFTLNKSIWNGVIERYPANIKITNGTFRFTTNATRWAETVSDYEMATIKTILIDVVFDAGKSLSDYGGYSGLYSATRTFFRYPVLGATSFTKTDCYCIGVMAGVTDTSSTPFLPSAYLALMAKPEIWLLDGVTHPKTIASGRTDLTQKYAIKGKTLVGGTGKKRVISVFVAAYMNLLKKQLTDSNGNYVVDIGDVYDPVVVMHHDDYGYPFSANKAYALGDSIHPKLPNGYAYDCTTAGVSASIEPQTWPTSGSMTTGSAIFTPRPIYKPESQLVQPVKIDLLTGQPV